MLRSLSFRVSIRLKLVIVLVLVGILPLSLVGWLGHWSTSSLGREVADEQRVQLLREAEFRLKRDLQLTERRFGRMGALMFSLCEMQAELLRLGVARHATDEPSELFGPESFDGSGPAMEESARHGNVRSVSYEEPLIVLAESPDPGDARLLSEQARVVRALRHAVSENILWQFTILPSGSYMYYPGCVPPDFDPLGLPLVFESRRGVVTSGVRAFVEPVSGLTAFGLCTPVFDGSGGQVGVTGVLVTLSEWASIAVPPVVDSDRHLLERVVTVAVEGTAAGNPRLYIIAEADIGSSAADGQAPQYFAVDSPELTRQIAATIADRSGRIEMFDAEIGGEQHFVAATGIDLGGGVSDVGVLIVRPHSEIVGVAETTAEGIELLAENRNATVAGATIGVLVLVLLFSIGGSRTMARPIRTLTDAVQRVASGDLSANVTVRTRDELQTLARAFNSMIPTLRDHVRVSQSLALATEVQQRLLPGNAPNVRGLEAAGRSVACDAVGGDYYDFLHVESLGDGELSLAVGDVTGHGIPAALLMTTARAMLRAKDSAGSLGGRLAAVNTQLARDTGGARFMTLCWMQIDRPKGVLRYANAGHEQPMVVDPADGSARLLEGGGIPLGIEARWDYEDYTLEGLRPGQVIAIGTDGIWEARNESDEMFGRGRFAQALLEAAGGTACEICDGVIRAVKEFRGKREQLDDITIVVVKVTDSRSTQS